MFRQELLFDMASLTAACGFLALSASWFNPLPDLNQYCTVLIWRNVGSSPSKRFNENDFGFSKVPIVLDGLGAISAGALAHCWQRRVFPGGGAQMLPTCRTSGSEWTIQHCIWFIVVNYMGAIFG